MEILSNNRRFEKMIAFDVSLIGAGRVDHLQRASLPFGGEIDLQFQSEFLIGHAGKSQRFPGNHGFESVAVA